MQIRLQDLADGFELPAHSAIELSNQLMADHPAKDAGKNYAIRVVAGGAYTLLADHVEARVFNEKFGDSPQLRRKSWSGFRESSFSILGLARIAGCWVPVATFRVCRGSNPQDFKSIASMEKEWRDCNLVAKISQMHTFEWTNAWEIATLAIDKNAKSMSGGYWLVLGMIRSLRELVLRHQIKLLFGIIATDAYRSLNRVGPGLTKLEEQRLHDGVPSVPFVIDTDQFEARSKDPEVAGQLLNVEDVDRIDIHLAEVN